MRGLVGKILLLIKILLGETAYSTKKIIKNMRNKVERKRLVNKDFTILAQNCIGTFIYHDLGLQFLSPTINLYFSGDDFVKFLGNLDFYLDAELTFVLDSQHSFPIGRLHDISVYFMHYQSNEEALKKWNQRKKHINRNNLFVIMTDKYITDKSCLDRFGSLPYNNKVIFVSRPTPDLTNAIYIRGYENNGELGEVTRIKTFSGKRGYEVGFDVVKWLNG